MTVKRESLRRYRVGTKDAVKLTGEILGNKRKYRRALIVIWSLLIPLMIVLCVGFYTGEISRIIEAWLK